MALRWKAYAPNTILRSVEVQDLADNGVVQLDTAADLASADLVNANVTYVVAEAKPYVRIAAGVGADKWKVFSAGAADFSNAATGTYTDQGVDYKYVTFTASDTLDVTQAGLADILVVGGGGGGTNFNAARGGGAGEVHYVESILLDAAAYSVTVGGGGAGASVTAANGNLSSLGSDIKAGRGGGSRSANTGDPSIIGGGGSSGGLRNNSTDNYNLAGGGAGHDTWGGANNYDGRSLSITGSAVVYGLGGHTGTTGTVNRGDGGYNGGAGGSGVVIIRVKV